MSFDTIEAAAAAAVLPSSNEAVAHDEPTRSPEAYCIPADDDVSEVVLTTEASVDPGTDERQQIYRLRYQGTTLMIAKLVLDSNIVHGHKLKKGEGKYHILTVFARAMMTKWPRFDSDVHCVGAYILWPKKNATLKKPSSGHVESQMNTVLNTVNYSECGENVESKKPLLEPCNCRAKCVEKLAEPDRVLIHQAYWDMGYSERVTFVMKNVNTVAIKRRKVSQEEYRKQQSRVYSLNGINVCKVMFMSSLGYSADKFITTAINKNTTEDLRGRHKPKHSLTEDRREEVTKAIQHFEPHISHYRREHAPHRLYVDPSVTIDKMYEHYKTMCSSNPVSKSSFTHVLSFCYCCLCLYFNGC